ncbi:uncharacterized protein LOC143149661 [Ptiloglossa arizonensis]|uniref:uncharacterized protein LOC143149661 n=1 Tax=Ptiloglossa arizonensis TaxID=3350558 RepID=UPI003F9FC6A3
MRGRIPELGKLDQFSLTNTKLYSNHDTMANSGCVAGTELTLLPSTGHYGKLALGATSAMLIVRSNRVNRKVVSRKKMERDDGNDAESKTASTCDMLATLNSYELYRIDEEIQHSKSELIDCRKECESTEMEMITVNQLEDKGIFILKDMERKYKELDDELEKVHHDYIKCANNVNRYEEAVSQKVSSLTQERDNLRKELSDLRKVADENSKKLIEIKKMITIQEKKNIALIQKLKKLVERRNITQDLKERVNAVLSDPRITNVNVFTQKIE